MSDITERPSNNFFIIFIHGHLSNRPKTDGHLKRKGSSLQKFEMAEKFCSAPLPHPLWDHYYAKAIT
jgi:hypothetical protein